VRTHGPDFPQRTAESADGAASRDASDDRTVAQSLSALFGEGERVTVGRLLEAGGERAFALLLILLSLPNAIFAPPVLAGIVAAPMAMLGIQLILGRSEISLPEAITARPVATSGLRRLLDRAHPWLDRLEFYGRPRLTFAAGPVALRVLGVFAVAAAVIVLLPVPGTNVLPALALVVMAAGTLRRDGLLFLAGAGIGLAGILVAAAAAGLAVGLVRWAWRAI
jgi:hypothetical protein